MQNCCIFCAASFSVRRGSAAASSHMTSHMRKLHCTKRKHHVVNTELQHAGRIEIARGWKLGRHELVLEQEGAFVKEKKMLTSAIIVLNGTQLS